MKNRAQNFAKLLLGGALLLHFAACGTILHPERKGQKNGDIDAGIAVLDGIGLLFGILPGVIAFAVDFSNGTIYLPSGKGKHAMRLEDLRQVRFDPKSRSMEVVERIIEREIGRGVRLDWTGVQTWRLESKGEMLASFARMRTECEGARSASGVRPRSGSTGRSRTGRASSSSSPWSACSSSCSS
ncbi:MAG: hypothetical protein HY077_06325 [Elusimicrobia bacterium]|nr:hypothetical protein [Elusimicrobiota bacterium]